MVTGIRKPTWIPAHLRHPWLHQKFIQHPLHAVTDSTWMASENRLMTSTPDSSFLMAFRPSVWNIASGIRNGVHNSWSRHDIGHCIQVIKDAYHFDPEEQSSMRIFNIKGNIQGHLRESGLAAWHLVGLSRSISCQLSGNRGIMQALCSIAVSHAGLMITQSSLITRRL